MRPLNPDELRDMSNDLTRSAQQLRDERPATKEAWEAIAAIEHAARWLWSAAASLHYHRNAEAPF